MDVAALISLQKISHKETPLAYPPVNELHCLEWVSSVIQTSFVASHDGKIVGSIGIGLSSFPWNREHGYLDNQWFYVVPKYRRHHVGKMLLEAAKYMSDQISVPFIFSVTSGIDNRIARYVAMQGFTPMGDVLTYGMGKAE